MPGSDYVEDNPSRIINPDEEPPREQQSPPTASDDDVNPEDILVPGAKFVPGEGYVVDEENVAGLAGRLSPEELSKVSKSRTRARVVSKDQAMKTEYHAMLMAMGNAERDAFLRFSSMVIS